MADRLGAAGAKTGATGGNLMFKRKRRDRMGEFPSIMFVNNAMRFLMEDPPKVEVALEELYWAVTRSGGGFHDDVKASYEKLAAQRQGGQSGTA